MGRIFDIKNVYKSISFENESLWLINKEFLQFTRDLILLPWTSPTANYNFINLYRSLENKQYIHYKYVCILSFKICVTATFQTEANICTSFNNTYWWPWTTPSKDKIICSIDICYGTVNSINSTASTINELCIILNWQRP